MEVPVNIVPENPTEASVIHFEPGTHPKTASENIAVFNDFNNGNLDAHGWNKEVTERIASYAYNAQALLLTIDGLEPQPPSAYDIFSSPLQDARDTWVHLPTRPNRLNHSGKVYVVKGDTDFYRLPQSVLPITKKIPASIEEQMATRYNAEATNAASIEQIAIVEESAGIAALGAVLWGASKLLSSSVANSKMSRRQFLEKSLAVTTSVVVAGSLLRLETPNIALVPNEPTKDFLQTVANIVRPGIARPLFIDGRTALLLAKAEDAQATLDSPSPENVVMMGSAHLDMAQTYMQDKTERNKAIATYAQELLDVAKQVYSSYYHISSEQIPPKVTNSLLNYVSQTDIVEVTDPGGSSFQPNFPSTVDKQITPYKSFNSPQVVEAIKGLRPQE